MGIGMQITLWATLVLSVIAILFAMKKSGHIVRVLIFSAFSGVLLLGIVSFTAKYTGVVLPFNPFTVTASCIGGIPAVITMLFLKMI